MDINYLCHRQQVEMMRADASGCAASRADHVELAALYDAAIERYRQASRAEAN